LNNAARIFLAASQNWDGQKKFENIIENTQKNKPA
jgi:hypothetical protein